MDRLWHIGGTLTNVRRAVVRIMMRSERKGLPGRHASGALDLSKPIVNFSAPGTWRTPVIIKANGGYVPAVDAETRLATSEPQQFRTRGDGSLAILPRDQWVDEPTVLDVGSVSYR